MANNATIDGNLSVGGTLGSVGNLTVTGNLVTGKSTATGAANAVATLNNKAGIVGTTSLAIPAGTQVTFTITNSVVAPTDIIFASVQNSSNTGGLPFVSAIAPFSGGMTLTIANASTTGANNGAGIGGVVSGTLSVSYLVFK